MKQFDLSKINLTKYLFFTGKGGVGKTSTACATAVTLADNGKKVLLVSTDPASNLQDVFETELNSKGTPIKEVKGLVVANLDPIKAAEDYKEVVIAPYRGKLPDSVLANMEEQLSGSCTVEIAAFNEFSNFITNPEIEKEYDNIIFDTAPTGHTLRMLQLPSAWSNFISDSTHGASCLGQLSGLEDKKGIYKKAVETLSDSQQTTLILVSRPEEAPLKEAKRASNELYDIGVKNQSMVINGMLDDFDDEISKSLYDKQQLALKGMPKELSKIATYYIPLRAYNVTGVDNVRALLKEDRYTIKEGNLHSTKITSIQQVIDHLAHENKKVIFTMGKGGVGKTTIAATIALGLSDRGKKVHLATTDPAAHLKFVLDEASNISMSYIDEEKELHKYQEEVLNKARETMSEEDIAYVEEDLNSPCTQEIAVFRAFAEIVEKANNQVVVIDTAPTGHTLLLLDATQSYHKEIERTQGDIPESVKNLLPRLRNKNETAVIIVSLAEATPIYEAIRLEDDLHRAGINSNWWVINSSLHSSGTTNKILKAKSSNEIEWINKVYERTNNHFALIGWNAENIKGNNLRHL
ncbi:MAG: arsenical pump-driving ATPase [Lachnospirales bacterium]